MINVDVKVLAEEDIGDTFVYLLQVSAILRPDTGVILSQPPTSRKV